MTQAFRPMQEVFHNRIPPVVEIVKVFDVDPLLTHRRRTIARMYRVMAIDLLNRIRVDSQNLVYSLQGLAESKAQALRCIPQDEEERNARSQNQDATG